MNKCLHIVLFSLLWGSNVVVGQLANNLEDVQLWLQGQKKVSLRVEKQNAIDSIQSIIQQTKIPICFESEGLDPKRQGITTRSMRRMLEVLATKGNLSDSEQARLKNVTEIEKDHPESIVSWDLPAGSFNLREVSPLEILKKFH